MDEAGGRPSDNGWGGGLRGSVGIGGRGEPLARVVGVADGVAVAVGHGDAVAGVIVGVAEASLGAADGGQVAAAS